MHWNNWNDSSVALVNSKQLLDGLGLASVPWGPREAAIAHPVDVNEFSQVMQMD